MGAISIMMIQRTSMTSTSGVTLMSAFSPPFAPPTSIAMGEPLNSICEFVNWCVGEFAAREAQFTHPPIHKFTNFLRRLLDEVVEQLRRRVVHFDVEVLDTAC